MNVTDPIRRHAELNPHALAVIRPDGSGVSYRDLDRAIDAVARRAIEFGLGPGNTVGISISGHYRFVVLMLALARLGAASAPMTLPAEQLDLCVAGAGMTPDAKLRVVPFDAVWAQALATATDVQPLPSYQDGAAVCSIFSSSGTTGSRKHIAFSHDMLVERILWKFLAVRPPENARQVSTIGPGTSYGFHSILRILWIGGLVVLPGRRITIEKYIACIERHQVNFMLTAPGSLGELIASMAPGVGPIRSLQAIEVSGSALPIRLYEVARERLCPNIVFLYGATEASSIASAPMAVLHGHPQAVGYVHPGVEVQAVDDNDMPVPPGTEGLLRVRSPLCIAGYLDDALASATVFKGGWFYPGDVGSVSRGGLLTVIGRVSELINRGGVKVSPHVIEDVLSSVPEIKEVAAFGAPGTMGVTQIWAAIVPKGTVDMPAVQALCARQLGDKAPKYFLQLSELPRNDAGKILRNELTAMANSARQSPAARA